MQDHSDPVNDYKKDYDIADFIGSSEFQGEFQGDEVILEQQEQEDIIDYESEINQISSQIVDDSFKQAFDIDQALLDNEQ